MTRTTLFLAIVLISTIARAEQASLPTPPPAAPAAAVATPAEDAPETLISGPVTHGGFGGPVIAYTRFAGEDSLLVGARGGWLVNHSLVLGVGGYGITNRVPVPTATVADAKDYQLNFGYGGLFVEYIIAPGRLVHGSVGVLVGGGGLMVHRFRAAPNHDMERDSVFVVDPNISIDLNVARFVRVALDVRYRFVAGVDLAHLTTADVRGVELGVMAKFGKF